jgi:hypothetical protein
MFELSTEAEVAVDADAVEMTCVCCHCKRERTDADEWREHAPRRGERLTHGICPACMYELYPDIAPLVRPRR